ncbi:hypothetical protein [Macrococcus epidermidis]|uniref:hypothetical protein n=1 Tax=Macrococcus epidermidis TaxID=1902580 RepID=UPI0020B7FFEB|nr:hypothetical protein [Macrococcus epidermidis]UTH16958.1 hypothetical protein KFV12_04080 [Macrococcus epidermidis]
MKYAISFLIYTIITMLIMVNLTDEVIALYCLYFSTIGMVLIATAGIINYEEKRGY